MLRPYAEDECSSTRGHERVILILTDAQQADAPNGRSDRNAYEILTKSSGLFSVATSNLSILTQACLRPRRWLMSLTVFIGVCVLGIDFLIYILFQWTFGDKRRALQQKLAQQRQALQVEAPRPFLVSSQKVGPQTQARLQKIRERMPTGLGRERRSA